MTPTLNGVPAVHIARWIEEIRIEYPGLSEREQREARRQLKWLNRELDRRDREERLAEATDYTGSEVPF